MRRVLLALLVLAALAPAAGATQGATAGTLVVPGRSRVGLNQGSAGVDIAIVSIAAGTQARLPGACYIIQGGSIEGCDENGDGQVDYQDVVPGEYVVTQTRAPVGYQPVADFPIVIPAGGPRDYVVGHQRLAPAPAGGVFVAIVSVDGVSQARLPGACYIINGGSIEGCDENGDGQVDFRGVAPGTYTVTETRAPTGYQRNPDFAIGIPPGRSSTFAIVHQPAGAGNEGALVAIASLDATTQARLAGACYIINGGSIEGCDENGDGQVDFRGVAPGTYTVTETQAPAGYRRRTDFAIAVPAGGAIEVRVAHEPVDAGGQGAFVAIVSLDAFSQQRLTGACYIINGGSIEGCDENGDGQVDFRGVPPGIYAVTQTRTPAGYQPRDDFAIEVPPAGSIEFRVGHVASGGGNVSAFVAIASVDAVTGQRLVGACYIINGGSIEGCDENADGQVDFQGVPPGTYTVTETRAPTGYPPVGDFRITVPSGAAISYTVPHGG